MENNRYTLDNSNDETSMVNEPNYAYSGTISQVDALWTLIENQAESVQRTLEERLHYLLSQKKKATVTPYTMEELHNRIMLSEQQFASGETKSHEEVNKDINALFESWN